MCRLLAFIGEDDSDIVPFFLEHYRGLGVSRFHLIVHGAWTRAALGPLLAQDVTIEERNAAPFDASMKASVLTRHALAFRHEWIIVADADEFLELPYPSLGKTIRALECLGIDELPARLVQRVAPGGELPSLPADASLDALFPFYDYRLSERMNLAFPVWKAKYPLVRVGERFRLMRGNHSPSNGRAVAHLPIRGAMHHFKWRDRLVASLARVRGASSNQREQDSYRYWLAAHDDRLPEEGCRSYTRAALFRDGLLVRPSRMQLRLFAATRKCRTGGNSRAAKFLAAIPPAAAQRDPRAAPLLKRSGLGEPPGRIALVTDGFAGLHRTGGHGTAMAALAERLAGAGHELHVFFHPVRGDAGLDPEWVAHWEAQGVRLHLVSRKMREGRIPTIAAFSLELAEVLRSGDWDVVHFTDSGGAAAAALLLRAARLAFQSSQIVMTVHGPTRWHRRGTQQPWSSHEAEQSELETIASELADVVVCPSAYISRWTEANYSGSAPHVVVPNALSGNSRRFLAPPTSRRPVKKIIFFGRIEKRKGIDVFFNAIERVLATGRSDFEAVFLGKCEPPMTEADVHRRTARWACRTRLLTTLNNDEAIDFLRGEDCVAVMPSRLDNSPYTVYECLENGIPFLASDAGGTAELIRAEDRSRVIVHGGAEDYAERLVRALDAGADTASLSFDPETASLDLLSIHAALVRRARASRSALPFTPRESVAAVIYGGAAPARDGALAHVLACWRASGIPVLREDQAGSSDAELLLFCHASVVPRVDSITALVAARQRHDADAVVCGYRLFNGEGAARDVTAFIGPAELSPCQNSYGAGIFLVRREALLETGGLSRDPDAESIAHWELLNRMRAQGRRICAVPAPLVDTAEKRWQDAPSAAQRALLGAPWLANAEGPLRGFVAMALRPEGLPVNVPAPRDTKPLLLADVLALRARAESPPVVRRADAPPIAEEAPVVEADENEIGRRRIWPSGILPEDAATYLVESAEDAEGCDFVVADGILDPANCDAVARVARADRSVFGTVDLARTEPGLARALEGALAEAALHLGAFFEADVELEFARIERLAAGTCRLPQPYFAHHAEDGPGRIAVSGSIYLNDDARGGATYFTGFDIAVLPRRGRLVASLARRSHERAILAVGGSDLLMLTFAMRLSDRGAMPTPVGITA